MMGLWSGPGRIGKFHSLMVPNGLMFWKSFGSLDFMHHYLRAEPSFLNNAFSNILSPLHSSYPTNIYTRIISVCSGDRFSGESVSAS